MAVKLIHLPILKQMILCQTLFSAYLRPAHGYVMPSDLVSHEM
jgi:hypothetical protein